MSVGMWPLNTWPKLEVVLISSTRLHVKVETKLDRGKHDEESVCETLAKWFSPLKVCETLTAHS